MRFTLEKYKGSGSRHTCPACGAKKMFVRYIDEAGQHLADHVGRCNRESNCGYHFKPKDYFAENLDLQNVSKMSVFPGIYRQGSKRGNRSQRLYDAKTKVRRPDTIDKQHLIASLTKYEQNTFVQFLLKLFPYDVQAVNLAVKNYKLGTKDGFTVFPTISNRRKVCKGKLIKFDIETGKRIKDGYSISSLESKLKKEGTLNEDFETDKDVFFGEHLLPEYPDRVIAIVEAEKTAVIASMCVRVLPDMVWLATGSKSWLNVERIKRLGRDRRIILYPDADGYEKWQQIASDARVLGSTVKLSTVIQQRATHAEKAKQVDLADYLIARQLRRNDPANRAAFAELIEERLAIMMFDGGLSEADAESYLEASGFVEYAESCVLR